MALNGRRQHWRERWSPDAELVFLRRMKLLDETFVPGDDVPEDVRKHIGLSRLRFWFKGGFIGLKDYKAQRTGKPIRRRSTGEPVDITRKKAGWIHVTWHNGDVTKVRGEDALQRLLYG